MSSDLYSFSNLWRCYRHCRRNKRNTHNALGFEVDAEANLVELQRALQTRSYRPGMSICFVTEGPKPREVFAADFLPRYGRSAPYSGRSAIDRILPCSRVARAAGVSRGCRKGKGVLAASDRLMSFLRRATANGKRPAWALELDVASFFPTIDKEILHELIRRHIRNPEILWLSETLLFHDPTRDYRFRCLERVIPPPGDPDYPIPARKSLFGKDNRRGLPIGNLTSQFWGNVYLNELDQYVKRTLKCRYYVRYVDDMILVHQDPDTLRAWRSEIAAFLQERLKLTLRDPVPEPQLLRKGVDFVGWKTFRNHRLPRMRTLTACRERLRGFERAHVHPAWNGAARRIDFMPDAVHVASLHSSLASYGGHLRHGSSYRQWRALWQGAAWLEALFARDDRDVWRLRTRWPDGVVATPRFSRQYRRLIRHAGERALVFCHVGRFVELYGPQREMAAPVLRLVRVEIGRGGYAFSVGFPISLRGEYLSRAVRAGFVVADVRERERTEPRCADRAVVAVWLPGTPEAGSVALPGQRSR